MVVLYLINRISQHLGQYVQHLSRVTHKSTPGANPIVAIAYSSKEAVLRQSMHSR